MDVDSFVVAKTKKKNRKKKGTEEYAFENGHTSLPPSPLIKTEGNAKSELIAGPIRAKTVAPPILRSRR